MPLVLPHDATDIFLSADYRGGYGWLFPKGAVANVGVGISVDGALADDKSTRRGLKAMLLALLQRLAHERRIGTNCWALTGGAIPVGGRLKSIGKLGATAVLLAGDAAGLTNPVTGAGIASAVQSGTMAGRAAADFVNGRADGARRLRGRARRYFRCRAQPRAAAAARTARLLRRWRTARRPRAGRRLDRLAALLAAGAVCEDQGEDAMSCLEGPRQAVPDFLNGAERAFNDAETMQPRAPGAIPADARNGARVKTQDVQPEGVYRPNYNFLTPNMRSPDYVQMSTAAAITLGVM